MNIHTSLQLQSITYGHLCIPAGHLLSPSIVVRDRISEHVLSTLLRYLCKFAGTWLRLVWGLENILVLGEYPVMEECHYRGLAPTRPRSEFHTHKCIQFVVWVLTDPQYDEH